MKRRRRRRRRGKGKGRRGGRGGGGRPTVGLTESRSAAPPLKLPLLRRELPELPEDRSGSRCLVLLPVSSPWSGEPWEEVALRRRGGFTPTHQTYSVELLRPGPPGPPGPAPGGQHVTHFNVSGLRKSSRTLFLCLLTCSSSAELLFIAFYSQSN